jgi:uncharacterized protein
LQPARQSKGWNVERKSRRTFVVETAGITAAFACQGEQQEPRVASQAATGSVPTRALGRTGLQVSVLGLGGAHIGQKLTEGESVTLIRRAIDSGVTFMDNCWDYNQGDSEVRMGKALGDGYRERVLLMTKIDGRTRAAASAQLEQSLSRLRTDVIDLVQVHEVIRMTDPGRCFGEGGTIEALVEAQKAGKLRFIGFTGHKDPKIHLAMLEEADRHGFSFDTVQMPLNVLDAHYNSFEANVLPTLVERGVAVLGMKSMGAGDILASGVVEPEECLRYALSLPVSVVICGMDSQAVLDENLDTVRRFEPLGKDEREALLARTRDAAQNGRHELFKTSLKYDGTAQNPKWLEGAIL